MTIAPSLFVRDRCELGEGPFWFDDRLWWVDVEAGQLHSVDGTGADRRTHQLGQRIGAAAPVRGGGFVVALEEGIGVFDAETSRIEFLHRPEAKVQGSRFNDGKCDPWGRFLAGTLNMSGRKLAAALYSLGADGSLTRLLSPVGMSNGLAWSEDGGTMYYIDTLSFQIRAFTYDLETGKISNGRVVVEIPESNGYPDGMSIDRAGNLWVAHWGGAAVRCWAPDSGRCIAIVPTPCTQPSSCCFGGANLASLFITSARQGDDIERHPLAGSVFVCDPGVQGYPVCLCGLNS